MTWKRKAPPGPHHNHPTEPPARRRHHHTHADAVRGEDQRYHPAEKTREGAGNGEWKMVCDKRRTSYQHREQKPEPPPPGRRSPPLVRTPTGMIQVCGQCLRPGHRALECRREPTCRTCGGVGHKSPACRRNRTRPETNARKRREYKPQKTTTWKPEKPVKINSSAAPPMKSTAPPRIVRNHSNPDTAIPTPTPAQQPPDDEEDAEHHYISLALDSEIMEGKERMKNFVVITVSEARLRSVDSSQVEEILKEIIDEKWL